MDNRDICRHAVDFIRGKTTAQPKIGVVLGSGLSDFCGELQDVTEIPFVSIPNFPRATVEGHTGAFLFGTYRGIPVVVLNGRLHYYEGYAQQTITLPTRVFSSLGVQTVILTNAAGGINESFTPGTLMLLTDHINFSGSNPLIGENLGEYGPRFPDMSDVYSRTLREALLARLEREELSVRQGIYMMYSGPSFETPAEIRMFRMLGADAVGMSTVPEAIVANHCGMNVLGISCITNMAAGILPQKLSQEEVIETAARVKPTFLRVLSSAIETADAACKKE
ncbi:MAG: purine-nucleoside phosphorylase [Oscillibacter sp.]|jgi:purine-nucleoside phosphorylase|nr:purine-nucleoside phosphorylase [Oscillibacter sp.]